MEIIAAETTDGVELHGILVKPASPDHPTVVHVHGKCGNFYQNYFVRLFASEFGSLGLGFLAMNTRGRDCIGDIVQKRTMKYIGGSVERFNESLLDLTLMYSIANTQSSVVVMQGHSFGCEKVMYYGDDGHHEVPIVLLSPSSSRDVQQLYTMIEIDEQRRRLMSELVTHDEPEWFDLVRSAEYGVRGEGLLYPIPISRTALIDLLKSPAMDLLNFGDGSWRPHAEFSSGLVYLGGKDPYITQPRRAVLSYLSDRFRSLEIVDIPQGNHHFSGYEPVVVERVADWVLRQSGMVEL